MIEVPISRGLVTLISREDESFVLSRRWSAAPKNSAHGGWYVRCSEGYLHRLLLEAQKGVLVDHRNGDGLDNRRSNLREADRRLNLVNRGFYQPRSGYRGVYAEKGKWSAQISLGGRSRRLGTFRDPADAARAYDRAALHHFGEFARLNFSEAA